MKNTPTILFSIATVFILIFGILKSNSTVDLQLHDFYLMVSYLHFAGLISLITGLTSVVYFLFDIFKRPIKSKIGILHFCFFMIGLLLFSINNFIAIKYHYLESNYPFEIPYKIWTIFFLLGIILFLSSFIVFLYGLIECIFLRKK